MSVPEETRHRLSQWCAARVQDGERDRRQVGYTIQGDEITIVERKAPTYPELETSWSTTPIARLRIEAQSGRWVLYRDSGHGWEHAGLTGDDPIALLDAVRA